MTRSNVLATVLYRTAVGLKNRDYSKLIWNKNRKVLIDSLALMQFLTHCIGMNCISDHQVEIILSTLKNTFNFEIDELRDLLNEASPESDISQDYRDLLFRMNLILSSCIHKIAQRKNGYAETVRKYILGFHNMPRAFLSLSEKMKISPAEAWEYSKSYLKLD